MVGGGLHHWVVDLPAAVDNLAAMLRPGGRLMMLEPNRAFALEGARRLWYRLDRDFNAATERALTPSELLAHAGARFVPEKVAYYGGPGYFLFLQRLVFPIPEPVQRPINPPLMGVLRG